MYTTLLGRHDPEVNTEVDQSERPVPSSPPESTCRLCLVTKHTYHYKYAHGAVVTNVSVMCYFDDRTGHACAPKLTGVYYIWLQPNLAFSVWLWPGLPPLSDTFRQPVPSNNRSPLNISPQLLWTYTVNWQSGALSVTREKEKNGTGKAIHGKGLCCYFFRLGLPGCRLHSKVFILLQ